MNCFSTWLKRVSERKLIWFWLKVFDMHLEEKSHQLTRNRNLPNQESLGVVWMATKSVTKHITVDVNGLILSVDCTPENESDVRAG